MANSAVPPLTSIHSFSKCVSDSCPSVRAVTGTRVAVVDGLRSEQIRGLSLKVKPTGLLRIRWFGRATVMEVPADS